VPWTLHYGGACGDLAAALRSVYLLADVPSRLVWLPLTRDGYAFNHVSVQIAVGPQWAWAEPCVLGARIGDHPLAAAARARATGGPSHDRGLDAREVHRSHHERDPVRVRALG
jgi:hypothetical protein